MLIILIVSLQLIIFEDRTNDTNKWCFITANDLTAMVVDTKLSQIAMYKDPSARPPLIYQPPAICPGLLGMRCGWRSVRSQAGAGWGTGAGDWYQEKRINWSKERT